MKKTAFKKPVAAFVVEGHQIPFSKGKFMLFSPIYDKTRENLIEIDDPEITVEIVQIFVDSIKGKEFVVSPEQIEPLYRLSNKWQYQEMIEYLNVISSASNLIQQLTEKIINNEDTQKVEQLISQKIEEAIKEPRFHEIPIENLYRIFEKTSKIENQNDLFTFLKNELDHNGKDSYKLFKFLSIADLNDSESLQLLDIFKAHQELKEIIPFDFSIIETLIKNKAAAIEENKSLRQEIATLKAQLNSKDLTITEKVDENQHIDGKNEINEIAALKAKLIETEKKLNEVTQELQKTKNNVHSSSQRRVFCFCINPVFSKFLCSYFYYYCCLFCLFL
ncbi:hypothetical protein TRFO_26514 [Tritrichomonas foetus]|uniref:BTB domain-containing protein n=1 Tax=Tritrichomonas foetus TaxID=1144522 RepID=A0A1J4K7E6_9EUKA|nr:hypothetical protein TRFO_26514 [Tritrichomonas foetus]|eukprot:OHT05636.1 hypothetical protein TRFO_26514 [Tritrichomonas foetus]